METKELTPEQEQAVKSRVIMLELTGLCPTQPSGWLPKPIASRESREVYYLANSNPTPYLPDRTGTPVFLVGTIDEITAWFASHLKQAATLLVGSDDYKTDNTNAKDFGYTGHGAVVTYAEHPSSLRLLQIQIANYAKFAGNDPSELPGEELNEPAGEVGPCGEPGPPRVPLNHQEFVNSLKDAGINAEGVDRDGCPLEPCGIPAD